MKQLSHSLLGRLSALVRAKRAAEPSEYREKLSTTTRFFRNYPQLVTIASTVPAWWPAGTTLRVLHLGGSLGCEALSFWVVMRELQPAYTLKVRSTDFDPAILEQARRLQYHGDFFTPIYGGEGSNPHGWREKWFDLRVVDGQPIYSPKGPLGQAVRFELRDISQPQPGLAADIVFCQNVLIHMRPELARRALDHAMATVRSPGLFICAGMDLNLKAILRENGFEPIVDNLHEIHEGWASQRVHASAPPGDYYFALEPLDMQRSDWAVRYSSIFRRP